MRIEGTIIPGQVLKLGGLELGVIHCEETDNDFLRLSAPGTSIDIRLKNGRALFDGDFRGAVLPEVAGVDQAPLVMTGPAGERQLMPGESLLDL